MRFVLGAWIRALPPPKILGVRVVALCLVPESGLAAEPVLDEIAWYWLGMCSRGLAGWFEVEAGSDPQFLQDWL